MSTRKSGDRGERIDAKSVAKSLGASRIVYLGKSKDILDMSAKARQIIEQMAASCDDYDEDPHDEPLTDD